MSGGWYDQHPLLLDEWSIIWEEHHEYEKRERLKAEREKSKNKGRKR